MPYQLRPLQHRQMLRDSRLRHARIASQRMNSLFALPRQLFEDGPARRIRKSAKHVISFDPFHTKTITTQLWIVKPININKIEIEAL